MSNKIMTIVIVTLFVLSIYFSLNYNNFNQITGAYVAIEQEINQAIKDASKEFGIPEEAIRAQIKAESNFNPLVISHNCGAVGIYQLMPGTAQDLGLKTYKNWKFTKCNAAKTKELEEFIKGKSLDELKQIDERFDIEKNIRAGTKYLNQQIEKFDDLKLALAAYNAGPTRVWDNCGCASGCHSFESCKNKLPAETQNYVTKIISYIGAGFADVYTELSEQLKRKELKIIGKYIVKPNFKVEIPSTIFNDFKKINDSLNKNDKLFFRDVKNCEEFGTDLKDCVGVYLIELNKQINFIWQMEEDCMDIDEKIFYDFIEKFRGCVNSEDDNCNCPEFSYYGKKFNIKKTENGILIQYKTENKDYQEEIEDADFPYENYELVASDSLFIKKDNNKIIVGGYEKRETCKIAEKRAFRICVDTRKTIPVYNEITNKLEENDIIIKFALYFPKE